MTAAGLITGSRPDPVRNDPAEIAAYVAANQSALNALFTALAKPCQAPPDLMNLAKLRASGGEREALQSLWGLLLQELFDSEFTGDHVRILRGADALLALSRVVPEHGTFLDHLSSNSFESTAIRFLARHHHEFTADQNRGVLARLEQHEQSRPSSEVIKRWDSYYSRWMTRDPSNFRGTDGFDWKGFLSANFMDGRLWKLHDAHAEYIRDGFWRLQAETSLLRLAMALRLHTTESGKLPARLDELTPKFIGKIPKDPFSTTAFVYRVTSTNWLLYSLGPDRVDDGGRPITPAGLHGVPKGDIVFTNRAAVHPQRP